MPIIIEELLYILPYCTLVSVIIYLLGYLFFCMISIQKEAGFSESIVLGFYVLVCCYAVIYTKGNTTLIIPLLVGIGYVWKVGLIKNLKFRFLKFHFWELGGFIFLTSLASLGMNCLVHYDNRLIVHPDIATCARLAQHMHWFAKENIILDPIYENTLSKTFYHYVNEWFTSFSLHFLTSFSALKILLLVVFPILSSIIFIQLRTISRLLCKNLNLFQSSIIALFVLLSPGIFKVIYHAVFYGNIPLSSILHGDLYVLKLKPVIVLGLASFHMYILKKEHFAIVLFSLIPILWNTLLPAYIGGLLLYVIYQKLIKNRINPWIVYGQIIYITLLLLMLVVNKVETKTLYDYSLLEYLVDAYSHLPNVYISILYVFLVSLPLLLLKLKFTKQLLSTDFKKFIFFIGIASFISFALLHQINNSIQIISNLFYVYYFPFAVYFITYIFRIFPTYFNVWISATLVCTLLHGVVFSKKIALQNPIPKEFNEGEYIYIATDLAPTKINFTSYYIRPYSVYLLNFKYWLPQRLDVLEKVSLPSYRDHFEYAQTVGFHSFTQYAANHTKDFKEVDIPTLKLAFLEKYTFKYLLIYESAMYDTDSYIHNLCIKEIQRFDHQILLLELDWK